MAQHEGPVFFERFDQLQLAQAELERRGYFFYPVPKEHVEALVTGPLVQRLRTRIGKRGFGSVAGHVAITISGYSSDPREVYAIPEARAYWQALDAQLPELPALLAIIPELRFNGPGMALTMLGTVDAVEPGLSPGSSRIHVLEAAQLSHAAVERIRRAGRTYHLSASAVQNLVERFRLGAGVE